MANTSDIRKGLCINYNNGTYKIVDFLHVKPGKGSAFVRTKLKSLTNGKVIDHTFPVGYKIEEIRIETRKYQYLYEDENGFYFMNNNDFSQIYLNKSLINNSQWMKAGEDVIITIQEKDEVPLSVELPPSVTLQIVETESGVKGNTATSATKSAIVETGARIFVPLFIEVGEKIKVDTQSGTYIERVK